MRDYDRSLPLLTVRGSELNQVWTNLLDNAIDALGESGTITITTRLDGDCVVVDIADDGPGIPAEVRDAHLRPVLHDQGRRAAARASGSRPRAASSSTATTARSRSTPSPAGTTFHVRLPLTQT